MGKRGPKPKPTKKRLIEGNPGHLRIANEVEPDPVTSNLAPAWVKGEALEKWNETAPQLSRLKMLTAMDIDRLGMYCLSWQRLMWSVNELSEAKKCIDITPNGMMQQSAWLLVQKAALADLRKFGDDFGMSPASRVGLEVDTGQTEDDFDTFRKSG
jgi:P27 family predicted phage terminase small subunit